MITAGIDSGAKYTKTVIIKNEEIIGKGIALSGFEPKNAADKSLEAAIQDAGILKEHIQRMFATGSGKYAVNMADDDISDIEAISKGAHYFFPKARTVADVGAEEGRAAKLDEYGNPEDFAINEKCAAGAGIFIEAMACALEVSIGEMGALSLQSGKKIPINAQCVIFAESEVVGLIHAKTAKADISKAIHDSMAGRIGSLIRRIGVNEDVVILGGVGYNPGFIKAMLGELKLGKIYIPDEPEFGAAVGAAVGAADEG
jgi:benzoyl-CoA reductase subunit D